MQTELTNMQQVIYYLENRRTDEPLGLFQEF